MGNTTIAARHKILLVDDDQDFLEVYWEFLKRISTQPEVHTASTGARALALLESEKFTLLIVDLNMPKMDGLQVLAIARRKYPQLRMMVLTSVEDEQFRARAYAMGVDQFWVKPESEKEVELLLESVEALLQRESHGGFRGVQSKSLVDIIQLECLSQNSGVLKVANGVLEGKIWIQNGAVIDAEAAELAGETAFYRILRWKTGSFESLPPDDARPRAIFTSVQALLLESAQRQDEARGNTSFIGNPNGAVVANGANGAPAVPKSPLVSFTRFEGVQFVLTVGLAPNYELDSWGVESPELVEDWLQKSLGNFRTLGDHLHVGELQQVSGFGYDANVALATSAKGDLCVGFRPALRSDEVRETMKTILAKWAS